MQCTSIFLKHLVLCFTFTAPSFAQWPATRWPPWDIDVGSAVWTNDSGAAVTGSVKDARAADCVRAADERARAAVLSTNTYRPRWYLWERANVDRFKTFISSHCESFADRYYTKIGRASCRERV